MQPNLDMIVPADFSSESRKRVRCDENPSTPELKAKLSKSLTEQRSPDGSDVSEFPLDGMKDATGFRRHRMIEPGVLSCVEATISYDTSDDTSDDIAMGREDNRLQETPDDQVVVERLRQARTTKQDIMTSEQPMTIHEVNAQWTRMTRMCRPPVPPNNCRISWSKQLHVTHVYCKKRHVDTEFEEYHEWLKTNLKKSQIEVKEIREQFLEILEKYVDLKAKSS